MEKIKLAPLANDIKNVFEGGYFGYTMIYSIVVKQNNSLRMVFLVDTCKSPFEEDLEKDGIKINVRMLEFVIYSVDSGKDIDMVISNTGDKNRLPLTIPIDESFQKMIEQTCRSWSITKITNCIRKEINNYGKRKS